MARTRRGRGEGSVFLRSDGLWTGSLTLGYDGNGKRRRRVVYGETKSAALEALAKLRADAVAGLLTDAPRQTLAEYLRTWLRDAKEAATRATGRRWRARRDLNPRPLAPQANALSTELRARDARWRRPIIAPSLRSAIRAGGGSAIRGGGGVC